MSLWKAAVLIGVLLIGPSLGMAVEEEEEPDVCEHLMQTAVVASETGHEAINFSIQQMAEEAGCMEEEDPSEPPRFDAAMQRSWWQPRAPFCFTIRLYDTWRRCCIGTHGFVACEG